MTRNYTFERMRRTVVPWVVAAAVYVLLTAAITWPLALHPRTLVPSDIGDPLLNAWIMWWNTQALPLTDQWWNAPQFRPVPGTLAFSEHLLGLAPITTPIIFATGDALLAYNVAFFLAFPLCALAAHALVFSIARRHDLAVIAGIAFAFAPYRLPQIAHVQVLSAYWMPIALLALHRYREDPRLRWLVAFAAAWLLQALACGYYIFFLSVLIVLWLAWFAVGRSRDLLRIVTAWGVAVALLAPVLYGYWRISRAYNLSRSIVEIRSYGADIASLLTASVLSRTWEWLHVVRREEADLFPGLTVMLVAAVSLGLAWRTASRDASGHRRAARILLTLAAIAGALSVGRLAYGPFKLGIGDLQLLSVTSPEKPISVAVACLAIASLLHPAVRAAWRRRSPLAFYALATVAMWLLSLGPSPTLMNKPALYKAPYAWLLMLPGMDGVRVPARFWMLGVLCLAVTAALGLRHIMQRWPRAASALPAIVIAGLLIDAWPNPLPMVPRPTERPSHTAADFRLDLPLGPDVDTIALFRATHHGRPLLNGYSGYFAPHYQSMRRLLIEHHAGVIDRLSEYGSIEIMVDHGLDIDGGWRRFVGSLAAAQPVQSTTEYTTVFVPRRSSRTTGPQGTPLPFTITHASVNPDLADNVHDGNLYTRWHAGREQRRGDSLSVDLGAEHEITGAELLIGGYVIDYARELAVAVSPDGEVWQEVWKGPTAILVFSGGLDRPRDMPIGISIPPTRARYIRFTQMGAELVNYWSVAELHVFGR